jgi:hypothetical protein
MTRAASQEERWDRDRDLRRHEWRPGDPPSFDQRAAVAKMVGYCEGIANSGILGDELEAKLRTQIAEVLVAFKMPSAVEIAKESADA